MHARNAGPRSRASSFRMPAAKSKRRPGAGSFWRMPKVKQASGAAAWKRRFRTCRPRKRSDRPMKRALPRPPGLSGPSAQPSDRAGTRRPRAFRSPFRASPASGTIPRRNSPRSSKTPGNSAKRPWKNWRSCSPPPPRRSLRTFGIPRAGCEPCSRWCRSWRTSSAAQRPASTPWIFRILSISRSAF